MDREKIEPEPRPSWRSIGKSLIELEETKRALSEWRPTVLTPDDPSFATNEVVEQARHYLDAWQAENYGRMANLITPSLGGKTVGETAGILREAFTDSDLTAYAINRARFEAASVCEVDVDLTIEGDAKPAVLRWIRETPDGSPATANRDGAWRLWSWDAWVMIARADEATEPYLDDGELF